MLARRSIPSRLLWRGGNVRSISALVERAKGFESRVAVVNLRNGGDGGNGGDKGAANEEWTYGDLLVDSKHMAESLYVDRSLASGDRVGFLCHANYDYVRCQWGVWRAGGVAVPLCVTHPVSELKYAIQDSQAKMVVASAGEMYEKLISACKELRVQLYSLPPPKSRKTQTDAIVVRFGDKKELPNVPPDQPAMIIYTSGTTGPPKGVVTTHSAIQAQVTSLVTSWEWNQKDRIVQVLPLHHVHGVINVVTCALWSGATCEMMTKFSARDVWRRFVSQEGDPLTLFMAVPTIYAKLIQEYRSMSAEEQRTATNSLSKLRLMVSGSAALPESIMAQWREVSGHTLLERYGMTEIGMALSNPLHGDRIPGSVGFPLPYVQARIVPTQNAEGGQQNNEQNQGELQIKGPQLFSEYFRKPEPTKETFTEDGWFKTGDIASCDPQGRYKILGRASVDILKSGGFKISALDIERELLEHPSIAECSVIGLPDDEYGQRIAAVVVLRAGSPALDLAELTKWAKSRMAHYKIPRELFQEAEIPKNAMGKVNKKELVKIYAGRKSGTKV